MRKKDVAIAPLKKKTPNGTPQTITCSIKKDPAQKENPCQTFTLLK